MKAAAAAHRQSTKITSIEEARTFVKDELFVQAVVGSVVTSQYEQFSTVFKTSLIETNTELSSSATNVMVAYVESAINAEG